MARWLLALGVVSTLALTAGGQVFAAGIGLTPNVLSFNLPHAGETATRRVTLYNMYDVPVTYRVIRTDVTYNARNEPEFNGSNPKSYAWLHVATAPVTLPAGKSHTFTITVSPAATLKRGELYGALLFVPARPVASTKGHGTESAVGIGLSAQVAVQVGPPGHVALGIVGRPLPWVVWGVSPTKTLIDLRNAGSGFASPVATLDVREGGRLVSKSTAVLGYVVPGATASMWTKIAALPPGIASATLTITAPGMTPIVWRGWFVRVPTSTVIAVVAAMVLVELVAWLSGRLRRPRRAMTYGEFQARGR